MANDDAACRGTEGYAESANVLVRQYESIAFADLHRDILHLIPTAPAQVLDIGAGTGRDAAALAALGHSVVAVEPTAELRAEGQRLHQAAAIVWIDDALPDLTALQEYCERFDFIMLSAVWMHLDADQRRRAMPQVAGLLRPGGLLALTLRHGPVPPGRRMFEVSAGETCALAGDCGLEAAYRGKRPSAFARTDVTWTVVVLRKQGPTW